MAQTLLVFQIISNHKEGQNNRQDTHKILNLQMPLKVNELGFTLNKKNITQSFNMVNND